MQIKSTLLAFAALLALPYQLPADNLIRHGNFDVEKLYPECKSNGGKLTLFTEDLTWNKCGKLEIDKIIERDGIRQVSAAAWIGGIGPNGGFPVKPDTVYRFSLELRGNAPSANFSALEWVGGDLWNDMRVVKTSVGGITPQQGWTRYSGTFKTGPKAQRAALYLQMWASSKYGEVKHKVGDYILFDNVSIEENTRPSVGESVAAKLPEAAPVKAARAPMQKTPLLIDGTPDEPAWQNAFVLDDLNLFRSATRSAMPPQVKMLADDANIYFAIHCTESGKVIDTNTQNGSSLWQGDLVEIFFGSRDNDRLLSQFVIGAGGGRFASHGSSGETANYDRWQAVTKKTPTGWTAEVRIPFDLLAKGWKPINGDRIAFNICRQRKEAKELATWAPVKRSFHDVPDFGELVIGDFPAALKSAYGIVAGAADRSGYETTVRAQKNAAIKARFERNAKRKIAVAQVPVTADFSVPFLPDAVFDPAESLHLNAAINEIKPLPLAIANFTDKPAEYRVILEHAARYNGAYGLKGFPQNQTVMRQAVRFKDGDTDSPSLRLDPLPKMNQAGTIVIPPKEAGLIWIDFNTAGVAPGTYEGRIRIVPLSEKATFKADKNFHDRKYTGDRLDLPVTLEVANVDLGRDPAISGGFFQPAINENMFLLMADAGARNFGLTPWDFQFPKDAAGNIIYQELPKVTALLRNHEEWSKKHRLQQPTYFIGFSTYNAFCSMNQCKDKPELAAKLWPQWLAALKQQMNAAGVTDDRYYVETFDEPNPKLFDELLAVHRAARAATPSVQLLLTLGAHIMSAADMEKLAEVTDGWVLWSHGYFHNADHLKLLDKMKAQKKYIAHYTCDTSMRSPLDRNYRRNAWFGEYHKLGGNDLFWFSDCYGDFGASDFLVTTEGGMVYRAYDEFLPSLRYMALRQGVTDVKYLNKLRKTRSNDPAVQTFLADAARRVVVDFAHDPAIPDKVRTEAAALLSKKQP